MSVRNVFMTYTEADVRTRAAPGEEPTTEQVSDFLTIQSFTNFGAMTGAITAAWNSLKILDEALFGGYWVPYSFAFVFALISLMISSDSMKVAGKFDFGSFSGRFFIGIVNALILASAVVGGQTVLTTT